MCAMPVPYSQEFREDIVREARSREDGITFAQIAKGAYRSVSGQPRQGDLIKLMGVDVEWPRIFLRPPRSSTR